METKLIVGIFKYVGIGIIALVWIYIAARMITRAIVRTIEEGKERK